MTSDPMFSAESRPFLFEDNKQKRDSEDGPLDSGPKPRNQSSRKHIFIHIILIILYTGVSLFIVRRTTENCGNIDHVFAGLSVKYRYQFYDKFNESPFAGPPSYETDDAWHNLMANMSIRVSHAELDAHGQTSIELPDGGYLAWLGVFHELHCVKMLRQWSYREHYHPNMTVHDYQHLEVHIDHCIDWLRSAAMCHADTSALATFKWDKGPHPMLNTKRVPHRCVDWKEMLSSHTDRMVSHEEVVSMVNPHREDPLAAGMM